MAFMGYLIIIIMSEQGNVRGISVGELMSGDVYFYSWFFIWLVITKLLRFLENEKLCTCSRHFIAGSVLRFQKHSNILAIYT